GRSGRGRGGPVARGLPGGSGRPLSRDAAPAPGPPANRLRVRRPVPPHPAVGSDPGRFAGRLPGASPGRRVRRRPPQPDPPADDRDRAPLLLGGAVGPTLGSGWPAGAQAATSERPVTMVSLG